MGDVTGSVQRLFREARRRKGLTQTELAHQDDCSQSAISMFESGRADALAAEKLDGIADILGIERRQWQTAATSPVVPEVLKYCPLDSCPGNVPYLVGNELGFWPTLTPAPDTERSYCPFCGELLETRCPAAACRTAVAAGAFCRRCGHRYVAVTAEPVPSAVIFVRRRQNALARLQALTAHAARGIGSTPASPEQPEVTDVLGE